MIALWGVAAGLSGLMAVGQHGATMAILVGLLYLMVITGVPLFAIEFGYPDGGRLLAGVCLFVTVLLMGYVRLRGTTFDDHPHLANFWFLAMLGPALAAVVLGTEPLGDLLNRKYLFSLVTMLIVAPLCCLLVPMIVADLMGISKTPPRSEESVSEETSA